LRDSFARLEEGIMTEDIEIGPKLRGALATPKQASRAGVIVIHEWHGLNAVVRAHVERFASEGFVALAPDLYHGQVASDDARASELMQALSTRDAMHDVGVSVSALHARGCTKVGIVGFCMGGAMAFAAASTVDGLSCAVPFYGIPTAEYWNAATMRVPIQAHFAKNDGWAKADRAEALAKDVHARGGAMEVFVYDAGHAFMREGDASKYDAASAKTAWPRAIAFLHAHCG
jgi:carboxymethylenebutenolidase